MRIATTAIAAASALLFAVSQAAQAAPSINLQDGVQTPAGMVDLVRKGGGGGGGKGFSGRGGGKGFSGRGYSGKSFKGGRGYSGRGYSGRSYAGRNFKGSGRGYSGRSYRGGGGYAYRGRSHGNYGKYAYKNRYYRRGYPFFWGGLALSGAYSAYGSNCGWLYRQAQATGSAYWWNRYQDCVYAY
jgi:hypothetical protein